MASPAQLDHNTDAGLDQILFLIPGYDPTATALPGQWFDAEAARHAIEFFPRFLRHPKGLTAKQPFHLEAWQKAIVANLFGWKNADGTRRYRKIFLYVPKKNGKSAFAAGLVLYVLLCDGEYGAEIYSVAATAKQAALVFGYAKTMVALHPDLESALDVYGKSPAAVHRVISFAKEFGRYEVLASNAEAADGPSVSMLVADELHRHPNGELVTVLDKSTAARAQPITLYTTTADEERESLCNNLLKRARLVRDNPGDKGKPGFTPSFLPVIYEAPKDADWTDIQVWRDCNPNMGVTFTDRYVEEQLQDARDLPELVQDVRRLNLNIVVASRDAWLDMNDWDACEPELSQLHIEDLAKEYEAKIERLRGRTGYASFDLGQTTDTTGKGVFFPAERDERGEIIGDQEDEVLVHFWIPRETAVRRERKLGVPYSVWEEYGFVTIVDGGVVEYGPIEESILDDIAIHDVQEVGYDPWQAERTRQFLELESGVPLVKWTQQAKLMGGPSKEVERMVKKHTLRHGAHPVLRYQASCTAVRRDSNGNYMPCKKRSTSAIDGMIVLVMCVGGAIFAQQEPDWNAYYEGVASEDPKK